MGVDDAIGAFFASEVDAALAELATLDAETLEGVATTGFGAGGVELATLGVETLEGVATTGFGFNPQLGAEDELKVDDAELEAVEEADDVS